MPYFTSPNERLVGPLPRRDILAVCAFLGRRPLPSRVADQDGPLTYLDRLAAAAHAMTATGMVAAPKGLPPLGGRLLWAYRAAWCVLAAAGLAVAGWAIADGNAPVTVLVARLIKAIVLGAAAILLLFRRPRDPVAAILALAFLCWIVTSSFDFTSGAMLPALLDRLRFLLFALALLLFPDGRWISPWTRGIAAASAATFVLGVIEGLGLASSHLFLPIAILCVVAAIAALVHRYRTVTDEVQEQQLKWVALGLVTGVGSILAARATAALHVGAMPASEILFQSGIVVIALGFLVPLIRYRLYDAETVISRSAAFAVLTAMLVAIFAGSEALIETLGQQYLSAGTNNIAGAIAAAIAAVLLTPLHSRISAWAEARFQADLVRLKMELPELLADMPKSWTPEQVGETALRRIAEAVHASWIALRLGDKSVATFHDDGFESREGGSPDCLLRLPLLCPFGGERGALCLGPRPDGSGYGSDERQALSAILAALRRRLIEAAGATEDRLNDERVQRMLLAEIRQLKSACSMGREDSRQRAGVRSSSKTDIGRAPLSRPA